MGLENQISASLLFSLNFSLPVAEIIFSFRMCFHCILLCEQEGQNRFYFPLPKKCVNIEI